MPPRRHGESRADRVREPGMRDVLPSHAPQPDRISLLRGDGKPLSHDDAQRDGNAPKSFDMRLFFA